MEKDGIPCVETHHLLLVFWIIDRKRIQLHSLQLLSPKKLKTLPGKGVNCPTTLTVNALRVRYAIIAKRAAISGRIGVSVKTW